MAKSTQSYEAIHTFLKNKFDEFRQIEAEKTQTRIEDVANGILSANPEDEYNIALEHVLEGVVHDLDVITQIKLVSTLHLTPIMTRYVTEQIDLVLSAVAEYMSLPEETED
jgi:hypothetical protein